VGLVGLLGFDFVCVRRFGGRGWFLGVALPWVAWCVGVGGRGGVRGRCCRGYGTANAVLIRV
jgi:hypothetical protein